MKPLLTHPLRDGIRKPRKLRIVCRDTTQWRAPSQTYRPKRLTPALTDAPDARRWKLPCKLPHHPAQAAARGAASARSATKPREGSGIVPLKLVLEIVRDRCESAPKRLKATLHNLHSMLFIPEDWPRTYSRPAVLARQTLWDFPSTTPKPSASIGQTAHKKLLSTVHPRNYRTLCTTSA